MRVRPEESGSNTFERDLAALRARFRRVALVHDWLTVPGGSEQVLSALLELFPDAEIFTSVYDPEPWPATIETESGPTGIV